MRAPITTASTTRAIGQLCVGGDWACAHGDLAGLRHIARRLAVLADEPLHCELVALAELCRTSPERATAAWTRLKPRLYRSPLAT
jgi:hypothetical protein